MASSSELFGNLNFLVVVLDSGELDSANKTVQLLDRHGCNSCKIYKCPTNETQPKDGNLKSWFMNTYGANYPLHFIICEDTGFPFYHIAAFELLIPVVTCEWIHMCIVKKMLVRTSDFSPDERHIFKNYQIYLSKEAFTKSEQLFYTETIKALGGTCVDILSNRTTHLVTNTSQDNGLKAVVNFNKLNLIKFVLPTWIAQSFKELSVAAEKDHEILPNEATETIQEKLEDRWNAISDVPFRKPSTILKNHNFILGMDLFFEKELYDYLVEFLRANAAIVTRHLDESDIERKGADIYIGSTDKSKEYEVALRKSMHLGNIIWIFHVWSVNVFVEPERKLIFAPFKKKIFEPSQLILTYSNYFGQQRSYIQRLTEILGGCSTPELSRKNTHLISQFASGKKFETTKKWGSKCYCTNHLWLEECYKNKLKLNPLELRFQEFPAEGGLWNGPSQMLNTISQADESSTIKAGTKEVPKENTAFIAVKNANNPVSLDSDPIFDNTPDPQLPLNEHDGADLPGLDIAVDSRHSSISSITDVTPDIGPDPSALTRELDEIELTREESQSHTNFQGTDSPVNNVQYVEEQPNETFLLKNQGQKEGKSRETFHEVKIGNESPRIESTETFKQHEDKEYNQSSVKTDIIDIDDAVEVILPDESSTAENADVIVQHSHSIESGKSIISKTETIENTPGSPHKILQNSFSLKTPGNSQEISNRKNDQRSEKPADNAFSKSLTPVERHSSSPTLVSSAGSRRAAKSKAAQRLHHDIESLNQFQRNSKRKKTGSLLPEEVALLEKQKELEQHAKQILDKIIYNNTSEETTETDRPATEHSHRRQLYHINAVSTGCQFVYNELDLEILRILGISLHDEITPYNAQKLNAIIAPKKMRTAKFLLSFSFHPLKYAFRPEFLDDVLKIIHKGDLKIKNIVLDTRNYEIPGLDQENCIKKTSLPTKLFERANLAKINLINDIPGGIEVISSILKAHGIKEVNVISSTQMTKLTEQSFLTNTQTKTDKRPNSSVLVPDYVFIVTKSAQSRQFKKIFKASDKIVLAVEWNWCISSIFELEVDYEDQQYVVYQKGLSEL